MKKAVISILALIVIGTLSDLRALADSCSNYKVQKACIDDNTCYWTKNKLFSDDEQTTCVPRNSDRCFLEAGQFRKANGECHECPKGYYCPAYQMNAIRCPEGTTTNDTGKSQPNECEVEINCTVYSKANCKETAGCYVEIDSSNCYQYKDNKNTCLNDSDQNDCKWLDENGWLTEIGGSPDNTSNQGLFQWQQKVVMCNGRIVGNNPDKYSSTFVGPLLSFVYEDNHIRKCTDDSYCMWETENPEKVLCSLYDGSSSYCDNPSYGRDLCKYYSTEDKCLTKADYCAKFDDRKDKCYQANNLCSYDATTKKCTLKGTQGTLSDVCSDATDSNACSGINMGSNSEEYDACVWKNNKCISIFNYCSDLSETECKNNNNNYLNTCGWDNNENKCVTSFGYCKPTQCQKMTSSGWSCKTCTPGHYCEANSEEPTSCAELATSPTAAGTADQCLRECTFITTPDNCKKVAGCYWNRKACDFCPEGYYCPANENDKKECPFGGKSISPAKSITDCYLGRRYEYDIELSHKICDNTGKCIIIGPVEKCTNGTCSPTNLGKQKKALIYRN